MKPPAASFWQSRDFGIVLVLFGVFVLCTNDVLGKWLVSQYTIAQVLALRSAAGLVILLPLIWREGLTRTFRVDRPWLHAFRLLVILGDIAAFYYAVRYLPLADTMAIFMAAPLILTALGALVLGERIGWRRWTAVLVGFGGVLLILQPGYAAFSWPALAAVGGAFCWALMFITTRQLRGSSDLTLITYHTLVLLVAGGVMLPFAWNPPTTVDFALLCLLGVVATAAHFCFNRAAKLAPASLIAPFQYTMIVWSALWGWVVFNDVPGWPVVAGALLVTGSGLYVWWRERVEARAG